MDLLCAVIGEIQRKHEQALTDLSHTTDVSTV